MQHVFFEKFSPSHGYFVVVSKKGFGACCVCVFFKSSENVTGQVCQVNNPKVGSKYQMKIGV